MTSCCIFGISGISCVTASVLTVTLRAEDLGSLLRLSHPLGKGPPAEMLRLLANMPMVQLFLFNLRGRWGFCARAEEATLFPQLHISHLPYTHTFHRQLCVKNYTPGWLLSLPACSADTHTPTHSLLCSLRQPGLPAGDSDGLFWTRAIHIPPTPGCHWF